MKLLASFLLAAAVVASGSPTVAEAPPGTPTVLDAQSNALFRRMVALNGALRTYKATVHLDVALKSFPFISPSLDGTAYYKKPDKEAIVFDTVPALASQFKKVYPKVDPPGDWLTTYEVYVLGDASGSTTFRLVPKKNGRVDHLDVKADDANATITGYTWTYKDGGYVTFDQSYKSVDGNFLVDKQTGRVELPSYKADVTSQFSNYRLNVGIADSVFEGELVFGVAEEPEMALETIDLIGGAPRRDGLADAFLRPITYLRISVTDRCNLRCTYCMPEAGLPWIPNADVLSFDEIERIDARGGRHRRAEHSG